MNRKTNDRNMIMRRVIISEHNQAAAIKQAEAFQKMAQIQAEHALALRVQFGKFLQLTGMLCDEILKFKTGISSDSPCKFCDADADGYHEVDCPFEMSDAMIDSIEVMKKNLRIEYGAEDTEKNGTSGDTGQEKSNTETGKTGAENG